MATRALTPIQIEAVADLVEADRRVYRSPNMDTRAMARAKALGTFAGLDLEAWQKARLAKVAA